MAAFQVIMVFDDDSMRAVSELNEKGRQCLEKKDWAGALVYFNGALALLKEPEHASVRAGVLNNLGHVLNSLGRTDDALAAFREAAALYETLGDQAAFGWQLGNIGSVLRDREDYVGAVRMYELALSAFTCAADQAGQADQYSNLGYAHAMAGNRGRARDFFTRALAIFEQSADSRKADLVRQNLAALD